MTERTAWLKVLRELKNDSAPYSLCHWIAELAPYGIDDNMFRRIHRLKAIRKDTYHGYAWDPYDLASRIAGVRSQG